MSDNSFKVKNSLVIKPVASPTLNEAGEIAYDSATGKIKTRDASTTDSVVTEAKAQDITGKTLLEVDNLQLNGNTIASKDTNGNIVLDPNGSGKIIASADIDVPSAGNLAVGASVGANTITIGGATSTVQVAGDLKIAGKTIDQAVATDYYGSELALGNMQLSSTTHATKGKIVLGEAGLSAYDEANDRLGIGDNAPDFKLEVAGDIRIQGTSGLKFGGTGSGDTTASVSSPSSNVLAVAAGQTLTVDTISSTGTNTDLTLSGNGSGIIKVGDSIDVTAAGNFSLAASAGANTITIGGASSTVSIPGSESLDGALDIKQIATPSNPASGRNKFYVKSDGFFYTINSSGNEVRIGTGAGSGAFTNFATNGNFELASTTGWTASAGTFAVTNTAANLYAGSWSGSWTPNAASDTLINTAFVITSGGGPSGNGAVTLMYKTASALHKLQVLDNATVIAELTLPVASSFTPASLNFIFPASSSGLNFRILAGDTTAIYLDEAFIGDARAVNLSSVSQASMYGALTWAGTTNCIWSRNGTWGNFTADADCPTPTVEEYASAPGTKIPGITFTSLPPGDYLFVAEGLFDVDATNGGNRGWRFSDGTNSSNPNNIHYAGANQGPGVITGRLKYTTTQTNITIQIQSYNDGSDNMRIQTDVATNRPLTIRAYRYPLSSQLAVTPDTVGGSWSGYHGTDCGDWSRTNAAIGDYATDASCTLTTTKNTNFGTVVTEASGLPGITFTPKAAGKTYFVKASFMQADATSNATQEARLLAGSFVVDQSTQGSSGTSGSARANVVLSGIFSVDSTSPVTLKVQGAATAGTTTIAGGANALGNIYWSIVDISQSLPAPILQNQVSTSASGGLRIEHALLTTTCTGSPCTMAANSPGISSVTRGSTGNYVVNFAAGTFSTIPTCVVSGGDANSRYLTYGYTTSLVNVLAKGYASTSAEDSQFGIICTGPR